MTPTSRLIFVGGGILVLGLAILGLSTVARAATRPVRPVSPSHATSTHRGMRDDLMATARLNQVVGIVTEMNGSGFLVRRPDQGFFAKATTTPSIHPTKVVTNEKTVVRMPGHETAVVHKGDMVFVRGTLDRQTSALTAQEIMILPKNPSAMHAPNAKKPTKKPAKNLPKIK